MRSCTDDVDLGSAPVPPSLLWAISARSSPLSFPTRAEIQAFSQWLALTTLKDSLLDARPDIAEVLHENPTTGALGWDLPPDRNGNWRKALAGIVRHGPALVWGIYGLRADLSEVEVAVPLDAPIESVRDAVLAVHEACRTDGDLGSPWRWGETERTLAVRFADAFHERGLNVTAQSTSKDHTGEVRESTGGQEACSVHLATGWGGLVLSNMERLNWVLDATVNGVARRIDLGWLLDRHLDGFEGIEDVAAWPLVRAVEEAAVEGPSLWGDETHDFDEYPSDLLWYTDPELRRVEQFLRSAGHDPEPLDRRGNPDTVVAEDVVARLTEKQVDLAQAQRIYAQLDVDYEVDSMVFTTTGLTRQARDWSERALMAIFRIYIPGLEVVPLNPLAQEYVPVVAIGRT